MASKLNSKLTVRFLTIPARAAHTATVIFIHGLGDSGHGVKQIAEKLHADPKLTHVKWVLPYAPMRPITIAGGRVMPAWFDVPTANLVVDDEVGMRDSIEQLTHLISAEEDAGIASHRIILGGFSQGAAMTMLTGLSTRRQLGGLIVLSGRLPLRPKFKTMASSYATTTPIFWGHGEDDTLVTFEIGQASIEFLTKDVGVPTASSDDLKGILFHAYAGKGHIICEEEIADLRGWMKKLIPQVDW